MELKHIYKKLIIRMSKWILSIIILFVLVIFSFVLTLQLGKQYEIFFIFIGFLLEIIFLPYLLIDMILNSINLKNNIKILIAFCTNLLFMHHSFIFIISTKYHNNIIFQFLTVVVLIIVVIRICNIIKIDKNSNFSILKSMSLFFVAGITMILYIFKLNKVSFMLTLENWINFYYLLPFLIIQGMYELLDGRTK
jgi:hypothetical protein